MSFILNIFSDPAIPSSIKLETATRMLSDPGLPTTSPPPTASFWLASPHSSFTSPPTSPPPVADIVIIGSGITGTSIARHLLRSRPAAAAGPSPAPPHPHPIVLLDARDVCSGATGRNGGHVNEVGYAEYRDLNERYGRDAAMKITRFRLAHLAELRRVVREEGLETSSQLREVDALSVFFGAKAWEEGKEALEVFKRDLGDEVAAWRIIEGTAEMERLGVPEACGVIAGRAGAIWPYRFVTGVLANLVRDAGEGFCVCQQTPATSVEVAEDGWFIVTTPRGEIRTRHVVHASNSHVAHLVPGFRSRVYPLCGQMSAQAAPEEFPFQGDRRSWSFDYDVGFDYLTQLPRQYHGGQPGDGAEMMFGGGFAQAKWSGMDAMGVCSDAELNPEVTKHLSERLGLAFRGADKEKGYEFRVKSMWTGTMGFSVDMLPWVGKLPESMTGRAGSEGEEWVSAAYSGEGMVNAWLCGKALAMIMLGQEEEAREWFPEEMGISEKRIKTAVLERYVDVAGLARKVSE